MSRKLVSVLVVILAAVTADANNVAIDVTADPPLDGVAYLPGEIARVAVRLRSETTPVTSLELAQVDVRLTNATLVSQFDPNDSTNPLTVPVIFGGAEPGDGQSPPGGSPQDYDGYPGPPLPGCPADCLIGSVPSSSGGGTVYFWLRISTSTAHLLNPPTSMPGLLFIQFKIQFGAPGPVTIDTLGVCIDDTSSCGAFFQQPVTGIFWTNSDADLVHNVTGGMLSLLVVPEPAGLTLLAVGTLTARRGERRRVRFARQATPRAEAGMSAR